MVINHQNNRLKKSNGAPRESLCRSINNRSHVRLEIVTPPFNAFTRLWLNQGPTGRRKSGPAWIGWSLSNKRSLLHIITLYLRNHKLLYSYRHPLLSCDIITTFLYVYACLLRLLWLTPFHTYILISRCGMFELGQPTVKQLLEYCPSTPGRIKL